MMLKAPIIPKTPMILKTPVVINEVPAERMDHCFHYCNKFSCTFNFVVDIFRYPVDNRSPFLRRTVF